MRRTDVFNDAGIRERVLEGVPLLAGEFGLEGPAPVDHVVCAAGARPLPDDCRPGVDDEVRGREGEPGVGADGDSHLLLVRPVDRFRIAPLVATRDDGVGTARERRDGDGSRSSERLSTRSVGHTGST